MSIVKEAFPEGQLANEAGEELTYKILVDNIGNVTLTDVSVTDTIADSIEFIGGDTDGDDALDVDETWEYKATHILTQAEIDSNGGDDDGDIDNTATAHSEEAPDVSDDADIPVVYNPAMSIDKSVPLDENGDPQIADVAGELLHYNISVANTGNVTLTNIVVSDPNADAGSIMYVSGDNGDGNLDVGETWIYTAFHTLTQEEIDHNGDLGGGSDGFMDNTATADSNETTPVSDSAQIPVQQPVFIPDADTCVFPWSLFSFQEDAPDALKVIAALDDDGIERQFLKFQINGHDLMYNMDFNNDGAVDVGGEAAIFHNYSALFGFPVIIDVLIVEALSSGDQYYDVLNVKPATQGGGVFDPNDPINTFFFLDELSDGSQGSSGNFAPVYLIGTSGNDDPLNGNNNSDIILGGDGNDSTQGNHCEDYVNGGAGNDNLNGSGENDYIDGGSGDDIIEGLGGNDVLIGGTGADIISGSGQQDMLYGGIDNDLDTMTGGSGDSDLFVFAVNSNGSGQLVLQSNNDVIVDFRSNTDYMGFLDYTATGVLADTDTDLNFLMDSNLAALSGHVTVTTGQFSGNNSTDTKLSFDGGGSLILESVNDTNVLNTLFNNHLIQVMSAI